MKAVDIMFAQQESTADQVYRCIEDAEGEVGWSFVLEVEDTKVRRDVLGVKPVYAHIPLGTVETSKGEPSKLTVAEGSKVSFHWSRDEANHNRRRRRHRDGSGNDLRALRSYSPKESRRLAVRRQGISSVLVLRVSSSDAAPTLSAQELSDRFFGTFGESVTFQSIYRDCSFGKMMFQPAIGTGIHDGVGEVSIGVPLSGLHSFEVENLANQAAITKFGSMNQFDHVAFCLPRGTAGPEWQAYAYFGWLRTVFNDEWCGYASALVHEVGHNLSLQHSREGSEYGDQSCMMGFSYNV